MECVGILEGGAVVGNKGIVMGCVLGPQPEKDGQQELVIYKPRIKDGGGEFRHLTAGALGVVTD